MKQRVKDKIEKRSTELLVISAIIVVGGAVATASSSNILDAGASSSDGLVAEYRFDTGAGDTAYDTSGGNNDGTINGASWTSGVKGGALKFDGNDDYVNAGDLDYISSGESGNYTTSVWVKFDTIKQSFFFGDEQSGNGGVMMQIDSSGYLQTYFNGYHTSSYQVSRDRWYHVSLVQNSSGISLFVNGKYIERLTSQNHVATSYNTQIGRFGGDGRYVDGKMDNIKVYSKALDKSQIKSMYNSGSWRIGTVTDEDDSSKVAEFSFQHQNSSHVLDTSGYNNHGLIDGSASQVSTVGCKVGRCYQFDNDADKLDNVGVDINNNWTVMTWFKYPNGGLEESSHWRTLTRGGGGDHQIIIRDGGYDLGTYDNTGGQSFIDCGYDINSVSNGWHHLAMSQKQGTSGNMNFYIDGSQVCSIDNYGSTTDIRSVGNYFGDGQEFGTIDQFKLFNRSLSQAEIIEKTQGLESNGAVLDMRFDSGGGDHVEDYSMEDNHGSLNPDEVSGPDRVDGLMGEALKFDGTDDYVSVPDSSSLDIGDGGLTVSAWAYLQEDSNGNNWMLFDKGTSQSGTYYLYSDGNSVRMTVKDGSSRYDASVDPSKIPEDKWIHLVGRYTGSQVELWLDGERLASNTAPANLGSNSEPVLIGEYQGNDYELEGKVDNAKIFSHAISESEIKQLYASGKSHVGSSSGSESSGLQDGLVLSQTFNRIETCGQSDTVSCPSGMSGEVAVDESGEANHGEVNGPTVKSAGDCKLGGCLGFSGGSVDMSYSENLNDTLGTLPVTISMWYKPEESVSDWQTVMPWTGSYDGGSGNVRVEVDGQQTALYTRWIGQDGSANWARGGGPGIETGEWQFHTSVITENQIKTFTNGELHSSSSHNFNSLANLDSDLSVSPSFSSSIDHVRVYNQSLSNQEVWKLYTNGRDREKGMGSPIGWWRLDSETYDATGEGNHGNNENGIRRAYVSGNLNFHADQWNGGGNNGEFDITCPGGDSSCWFEDANGNHSSLTINNGVACQDGASGTGYIMYSSENVHTRFSSNDPHPDNAENFICVRYNNGWEYDTNNNWIDFNPVENDTLVASVDFDGDTASKLTYYPEPVTGKVGEALRFDSGKYVEIPHSDRLVPNKLTVSAWVKPTETGNNYVVTKNTTGNIAYHLSLEGGNDYRWHLENSGDIVNLNAGNWNDNIGEWVHVTATYDGSTAKIYENGKLVGSKSASGTLDTSTGSLCIGSNICGNRFFDGKIDDVRIYPYALNKEQVKKVMNGGAVSVG